MSTCCLLFSKKIHRAVADKEDRELMAETREPEEVTQEVGVGCSDVCPPAGLIGADKYDYKYLCTPSMPWSEGGVAPPKFLAKVLWSSGRFRARAAGRECQGAPIGRGLLLAQTGRGA